MVKSNFVSKECIEMQKLIEAEFEGELNKAAEIAKNLLDLHMDITDISRITGLNQEQIEALSCDTTTTD